VTAGAPSPPPTKLPAARHDQADPALVRRIDRLCHALLDRHGPGVPTRRPSTTAHRHEFG
jgi:hypothetical protein